MLTVDDWAGCCHNYCKPVAKYPSDRQALRDVVTEGHPRFFLGTDSAPHPRTAKEGSKAAAGVYIPNVGLYLVHVMEEIGALDKLEGFASQFGREFYNFPLGLTQDSHKLSFIKKEHKVPNEFKGGDFSVVPFLAGTALNWTLQ